MKAFFHIAVAWGLLQAAWAGAPLEDQISAALAADPNVNSVTSITPEMIKGTFTDNSEFEFNLSNLRKEIANAPAKEKEIIAKYLRTNPHLAKLVFDGSTPLSRQNILPIVRNISVARELRDKGIDLNRLPGMQICRDLVVFYVDDHAETMDYLTNDRLALANIAKEDLEKIALENLRKMFPRLLTAEVNGFSQVIADSDYVSSMMLAGVWDDVAAKLGGEPVVGIPARDTLYFTLASDQQGLKAMQAAVERIFGKTDHPLSKNLYRWHDSGWVPFPEK